MNKSIQHVCTGNDINPLSRRQWLSQLGYGIGSMALGSLLQQDMAMGASSSAEAAIEAGMHHAPKAKRIIFLFQSGAPSQMDLFDYKPVLNERDGQELPASIRMGQRLTGMSAHQATLPIVGSPFKFSQHGESGTWMSDLLPHTAKIADELCVIKSMNTEAINHGPGVTMMQTGSQFPGRPSMGAWSWYGLGSENEDLPAFVVMVSKERGGQPLFARLWGSGFLPGKYDGVELRSDEDAVLYLNSPEGIRQSSRRSALDGLAKLHQLQYESTLDPAIENRIAQYEMAFRMQTSIPEVTDISGESKQTLELYGDDVTKPGSFAANCLRARRLAQRGVRFIQLYQPGWDHHANLPGSIKHSCKITDQPTAGLIQDLKNHGLLEDTLVIWGGEFGRTSYCQGKITPGNFGRDHHPRCFTMWMAGGGVKPGYTHGETDEFSYNLVSGGVHIHDLHATILHQMGIDHERLTFRYQGRDFRLTDVHGHVVKELIA
ncbi:hypothetical protein Poly51_32860 [Rubripirellula tenax]|uniref:Sulfatase n=1 Tax=Rubripirellula tenax TaxID=2528015 RepID=A0A5C6F2I2_9BACT|nr:DUF1501 domain-containing protein [Rubripirellula tenax]TWU54567.1 hypothetical protein Poly51_32860 [Rubripirellula tenax]